MAPPHLSGTGRVSSQPGRRGAHGGISTVLGWRWKAALPANIPSDTLWGGEKLIFLLTLNEFPQKKPGLGLIISPSSEEAADGSHYAWPRSGLLFPQSLMQLFGTLINWNKRSSSDHKRWGESVNPAILLCWPLDHHLSFVSSVYIWENTTRYWSIRAAPSSTTHRP